ncbi:hypothetical protein BaRGS_00020350 [Batillaria attramentaria]|uniref:Uncharacterized protein n=1 Tax=Batillaria attramentaria TaxID=370345 RepID=A0ABD0KN85_9CAEN
MASNAAWWIYGQGRERSTQHGTRSCVPCHAECPACGTFNNLCTCTQRVLDSTGPLVMNCDAGGQCLNEGREQTTKYTGLET